MDSQHFLKAHFSDFAMLLPPHPQFSAKARQGPRYHFTAMQGQLVSLKKFTSEDAEAEVSLL